MLCYCLQNTIIACSPRQYDNTSREGALVQFQRSVDRPQPTDPYMLLSGYCVVQDYYLFT